MNSELKENKYSVKKICSNCGIEYNSTKYSKAKTNRCRICSRINKPKENNNLIDISINIEKNVETFIKNKKEFDKFKDTKVLVNNGYWGIDEIKKRKFI